MQLLNKTPIINTLKTSTQIASLLPNLYKVKRMAIFANPILIPGITKLYGINIST